MRSQEAKTALSTWVICPIACAIGAYFLVDSAPGAIIHAIPGIGRAFISGPGSPNQTILRLIILIVAILPTVATAFESRYCAGRICRWNYFQPHYSRRIPYTTRTPTRHRILFHAGSGFFIASGMAVESELMQQHTAAIFVAKGALTVAIFPFLANLIGNSQKLGKTQDIETNWSSPRRVRSTLLSQGSPLSTEVKQQDSPWSRCSTGATTPTESTRKPGRYGQP